MPSIYRKLKELAGNQYYWLRDYEYVFRKQLFGAVSRTKAIKYRNPATTKPSVILIPGIYEKWQFMKPMASLLFARGYDIHVIEGLGYNHRDIEEMAKVVNSYIESTNIAHFILIAHSKGGLIGKFLLTNFNTQKKIKGLIALNTPFSGSLYAYFFLLVKPIRMFMPNSSILKYLAKNQQVNHLIVSIYGRFDPHIPGGSKLDGARNIQLETRGHFRIMSDPLVHKAVLDNITRFS